MTKPIEVVITLTLAQYRALIADFATLRPTTEAKTNTAAVCQSVAAAAAKVRRGRMKAA